ncbi:25 member 47 [Seminavis robusta]|uniref:25 member 47 n=1 Tax=Seminavis robusta TaxID=568900 RepID=A0A9N8HKU8_9STRA|nr:25 member 47 [Seminavis robusta]|eukprot:Sro638_g179590.1 25 member 47 (276) ;mRNA; r:24976-25803
MTEPTTVHVVVASTVAGFTSTILGHPLDTIKAHLQTSSSSTTTTSSWQVARRLQWNLFRGIGPPLVNAILMNAVMFSVFDKVNTANNSNVFVAGLLSGFATAMISTPTDWIKIQAQLQMQTQTQKSSWQILVQTLAKGPPRVVISQYLYRGHVANLAREGIFSMVYLGFYHYILQNNRSDDNDNNSQHSLPVVAVTSSLTGAMAWVLSYPMDTIKTLRQSGRTRQEIYQLCKTRGYAAAALYRGCATSTGRAMLVTSSRMMAYEGCMAVLAANSS